MTSALLTVASLLLPLAITLAAAVGVFVGAALLLGLSEIIADEARGWLEYAPRAILRLAAMRLPADQRQAIYDEEWLPELLREMRKGEDRPISRLVFGTWFALDMARGAGRVGCALDGVREPEREIGSSTPDLFAVMKEYRARVDADEHTYKHSNDPANRTGGAPVSMGFTISAEGFVADRERIDDTNVSRYVGARRSVGKLQPDAAPLRP